MLHFVIKSSHLKITSLFCNKLTVVFCNEKPDTFCNKVSQWIKYVTGTIFDSAKIDYLVSYHPHAIHNMFFSSVTLEGRCITGPLPEPKLLDGAIFLLEIWVMLTNLKYQWFGKTLICHYCSVVAHQCQNWFICFLSFGFYLLIYLTFLFRSLFD